MGLLLNQVEQDSLKPSSLNWSLDLLLILVYSRLMRGRLRVRWNFSTSSISSSTPSKYFNSLVSRSL